MIRSYLLFAASASAFALTATAQTVDAGKTVFTPEDFTAYAPRTALDMVARIPGFSLAEDNDGSRGFGEARGNVLIDGQRLSGKSNSASDALGRIQAARVVRIELADAAVFGTAGVSGQIVNIITNGEAGNSGTWAWRGRFRENLKPGFHGFELNWSGTDGALSWTAGAESEPERGANEGWRIITDGAGTITERRAESFKWLADNFSLSGSLAYKPASGAIANLNASLNFEPGSGKDEIKTFPVGGVEGRRFAQFSEDEWNGEIGADYEFGLGPGRLKTIGLVRLEHSPVVDIFRRGRLDGTGLFSNIYEQTADEGEYILRGEYAFDRGKTGWTLSLEGAYNYLESEATLMESVNGGAFQSVSLGLANSRVEEVRSEAILTRSWPIGEKFKAKVAGGAEYSEISQSGDATQVRTFTRPKGYADLTYTHSDTLKFVARAEREVGQLNFFDFISSINLQDDRSNAGNPDIVPQQANVFSLSVEKDLGDWGAITVKGFAEDIEDIVDRIPIGTGEGPGNLDAAQRSGGEIDATFKLGKIGFAGAELKLKGEASTSRIDDPLTGERRRINFDDVAFVFAELRQDVPNTDWAWGLTFENYRNNGFYRLSERGQETAVPGFAVAFAEHKDIFGLRGTLRVGNLLDQRDKFWRELYTPDRRGALTRREVRDAKFGPVFVVSLSGEF